MDVFKHRNRVRNFKTYIENVSELILEGKVRLWWLAGMAANEIVIHFTKAEIVPLGIQDENW